MKRVFIIHGWEASPESNWFPWLKEELEKRGIAAFVPAMPNPLFPKCEQWVAHLRDLIGRPDQDTILVGHSLGTIAILRYLETLQEGEKVGAIFLVSGFSEQLGPLVLSSFFTKPLDYAKVKRSTDRIFAVSSDNDALVPLKYAKILEEKLGAELSVMPGRGHLNDGDGLFQLPIVLGKILEIAEE